jgi:protein-S-isoprenylcysteine O-methyltransferase Ste14
MKKRLKINGIIITAALFLIVLFPSVFIRRCYWDSPDDAIEVMGLVFILLGQLLRTSARGYKAEYSRDGQDLVSGGPYSLVRNPMYLGIFFIGLGIVLVIFYWWAALIFLAGFAVRYVMLLFNEERKLLRLFGNKYVAYQKTVPRLFPSFRALLQKDISEYLPLKWRWIKKEIGTVVAVLLLVEVIESFEEWRLEGIKSLFYESFMFVVVLFLFLCLGAYLHRKTLAYDAEKR